MVPQLLSDGHHLSHIGSIEPPERMGEPGRWIWICLCELAREYLLGWDGCCLNGGTPTKVASTAGVEAAACTAGNVLL